MKFEPNQFSAQAFVLMLVLLSLWSCKKVPPISPNDLDSKLYVDSSYIVPENYLISASKQILNTDKPVIIAAHGFTATPFEWQEFKEFLSQQNDTVYLSRVLLGGHGLNYEAFSSANWKDWQQPIIDEYKRLSAMGFKHIGLAGSSTGCPLILNFIHHHSFSELPTPEHIFFIDPIIMPSNKMLNYVNYLGLFVSYLTVEPNADEQHYWYKYRPYNSLKNLNALISLCRNDLKKGIQLPQNLKSFTVFKVKTDDSAAPESAEWLYNGIRLSNRNTIDTLMLNSNLHVFTRLKGRNTVSAYDRKLQQQAFSKILNTITIQ